ncbi:pilus assembly protein PilZ [Pseudohongiella sp. SYSU M77423]|uniref:pilus assembly protein PilZ n=1 Tax=Pseudohongiella sp. SYSU M77423 TaxID=3042312 RepID=UPI002480A642|nr:pilus assembly protein PilZ [Pseudohongiella sp. SYSU M77423]MDH7943139.1 pilus assembly protein PilZ [Pseudohongiella sp. SYSU M77423]
MQTLLATPAYKPPRVLKIYFDDPAILAACYLPFLKQGGLFIPGDYDELSSDAVMLLLRLPGESQAEMLRLDVVCSTPLGVQGKQPAGIGLGFNAETAGAAARIREIISPFSAMQGNAFLGSW